MDHYHELAQQFLRDMVAFPTVNGNEKPLAQYIAGVLEGYGFRTQLQDIAENRSNVVAVYGSSDNRIIFTGHLDVVPPGGDWQVCDPFHLTEQNGRLYGRGSCEIKGGISAMMASAIRGVEIGEAR